MTNFQSIEQNYRLLSEDELQEMEGGGLLLIIGGGVVSLGLLAWGAYIGYQSAARGG